MYECASVWCVCKSVRGTKRERKKEGNREREREREREIERQRTDIVKERDNMRGLVAWKDGEK